MKKRKYVLSLLALLSIVFVMKFPFSDDAILKKYLDTTFLDRVQRDDRGGLPPKFYIIEENPTTDEIMRTLKLMVENDVNKTAVISKHQYFEGGGLIENVSVERLEPFEALKKYYTIKEATNDIVKGGKWEDGKPTEQYVDIPIRQAFAVLSADEDLVDIYAKDSFINKRSCIEYRKISFYGSYDNYEEYHNKVLHYGSYGVNNFKEEVYNYIRYILDNNNYEGYIKTFGQIVNNYYVNCKID
ncbi:hypothetical protein [uncultured Campylobacter sp.]|uniref:hypothetical protein n=1 Tax=uncultured Campylobacter sp. TaxID=218934 RepID=UPI0026028DF3|nr:hypothetical protein [uncultured Campylobacter sp.]